MPCTQIEDVHACLSACHLRLHACWSAFEPKAQPLELARAVHAGFFAWTSSQAVQARVPQAASRLPAELVSTASKQTSSSSACWLKSFLRTRRLTKDDSAQFALVAVCSVASSKRWHGTSRRQAAAALLPWTPFLQPGALMDCLGLYFSSWPSSQGSQQWHPLMRIRFRPCMIDPPQHH